MRRWVLEQGAAEMSQITDLPKLVLGRLSQKITLLESEVAARREAADGTTKILLKLRDGETIEVVRMKGTSTATACISTQVGCPMACAFCASGLNGLVRNLETHEILEQVVRARQIGPIGRIVVMGIGEPLLNLEALLGALDVVTAPDGIALSGRKITISTIGLPDRIRNSRKPTNRTPSRSPPRADRRAPQRAHPDGEKGDDRFFACLGARVLPRDGA